MRRRVADGLGDDVKLTKIANPYDTEADKKRGRRYGEGRVWDDACDEQMAADQDAVKEDQEQMAAEIGRLQQKIKELEAVNRGLEAFRSKVWKSAMESRDGT